MGSRHRTDPLVVGLAGYKGSGKTTVASAVAQLVGGTVASFGAFVRTKAQGGEDAITLADFGAHLLATMGAGQLVRETIEATGWDGGSPLIIEGIRHTEVLDVLLTQFPQFHLVFVDAPGRVREDRLMKRDGLRASAIATLQAHSTEMGVEALRNRADLVVDASGELGQGAARVVFRWIEAW
jgi:dephospho-CoA kinase